MKILRACFSALADDLQAELAGDSKHQPLYEHHARQIRQLFANYPDLPLHQDSVGGFLHGFLITRAYYVPELSVEKQAMFPVPGGTLLLARELPTGDRVRIAGDIPLTCATLGGFSLGVAYTQPYLPSGGGSDPTSLIAAACDLAHVL